MAIRISRNAEGNCINFIGSTNPSYWNSCLSAVVNTTDSTRVDVINDVRTENAADTKYEFYAIEYTEFADKEGNPFTDAAACVVYINTNANVAGVSAEGTDLTGITVNFRLDDTTTSIIIDNGSAFGVNTIKAVGDADGTIHIHAIGAGNPNGASGANTKTHFEKLEVGNVCVNGTVVAGGLADIVNVLNELFTVGSIGSVVINDPFTTRIANVTGESSAFTLVGATAATPSGSEILENSSALTDAFYTAGLKATETISNSGEYYTFDIITTGSIGFGLIHSQASYAAGQYIGDATVADPTTFAVTNTDKAGYQWSHWFNTTTAGSWKEAGARVGAIAGEHVTTWAKSSDWAAGTLVKVKVGFDADGFATVSTLKADGTWGIHYRSNYALGGLGEFHLGIKIKDVGPMVATAPTVHLLDPTAPDIMNFRFIESPDAAWDYPLFATEEEADFYDLKSGGTGTATTVTYVDDASDTEWYKPDNGFTSQGTVTPPATTFEGNVVVWTEITSLTNADLTPDVFSGPDFTQVEATSVNIDIGGSAVYSQSVTIDSATSGLVYNTATRFLQGTLTDVGSDTVYTITVVRANAFGSTTGSFTITATDTVPFSPTTTVWTKALDINGSAEFLHDGLHTHHYICPMLMNKAGGTVGYNSTGTATTAATGTSYPWHNACVFQNNGAINAIFGQLQTSTSVSPSILVKVKNNKLVMTWGYYGDFMKAESTNVICATGDWVGLYVSFNGNKWPSLAAHNSGSGDDTFKFCTVNLTSGVVTTIPMTWSIGGTISNPQGGNHVALGNNQTFKIGKQYSDQGPSTQSFKLAAMVESTLKVGQTLPIDAEISMMVRDPIQWELDYKEGATHRPAYSTSTINYTGDSTSYYTNHIWLMGDGTSDQPSVIRNQTNVNDTSYTYLLTNSMVSNDLVTVNIAGLTP